MKPNIRAAEAAGVASALASDGPGQFITTPIALLEARAEPAASTTSPRTTSSMASAVQGTARSTRRLRANAHRLRAAISERAPLRLPVAVAALAAILMGLEPSRPLDLRNPDVGAAVQTALTLCGLLSAYLLLIVFANRRRVSDLLLLLAVMTLSLVEFAFSAVPALSGDGSVGRGAGVGLGGEVVVSLAFAAAAFVPVMVREDRSRRPLVVVLIAAVASVGVADLIAPGANDPVTVTLHVLTSIVLVVAGIGFVKYAEPSDSSTGLLAGATFLLAATMLEYVAIPAVAADSVTLGMVARMGAQGLLLIVALRRDARLRQDLELEAVAAERQRLARDLHDGLAQDLAVIAAHGPHLMAELGPDHPLVIAAERSLAASRGAIVDLSGSGAPTTGAALREVADELEARFRVKVDVHVRTDSRGKNDLDRVRREEMVRIAREAIVNAARHGGARRIDVELDFRGGRHRLRVTDDGCGIGPHALGSDDGFGVPTMRARAASIGGRLVARRAANGGTELEILVP